MIPKFGHQSASRTRVRSVLLSENLKFQFGQESPNRRLALFSYPKRVGSKVAISYFLFSFPVSRLYFNFNYLNRNTANKMALDLILEVWWNYDVVILSKLRYCGPCAMLTKAYLTIYQTWGDPKRTLASEKRGVVKR